jgi:HEAT repeat protein
MSGEVGELKRRGRSHLNPRPRDLQGLMRDLKHPERRVRRDLIRHLYYSDDPRAPALLSRMVNADSDGHIRYLARKALHLLERRAAISPRSRPGSVNERLRAPSAQVRQTAVWELARLREPHTFELLVQLLPVESDQFVRTAIARALPRLGGEKAIPQLRGMLTDPANRVRAAAVDGLAETGHAGVCRDVLVMLCDHDERVRQAASRGVLSFGFDRVLAGLKALMSDATPSVREVAVRVMQRLHIADLWSLLERATKDTDGSVRETAQIVTRPGGILEPGAPLSAVLDILRNEPLLPSDSDPLDSPVSSERLEEAWEIVGRGQHSRLSKVAERIRTEPDGNVRATLVMVLGLLKARESTGVLLDCLNDTDDRVRANAVEAVGLLEDPSVLKCLVPLLRDPAARVRANAIIALKRTRGLDLEAPMQEIVQSGDSRMACSAIYAITDLNTSSMARLLGPLLDHPETGIRSRTLEALELMRRMGNLVAGSMLADVSGGESQIQTGFDFTEQDWDEPLD